MRVVDTERQWIGYRLNILGIRVFRTYCQLSARRQQEWVTVGAPRDLPVEVPDDMTKISSDPLLLTIRQYCQERPGSDLLEVLSGKKPFDRALQVADAEACG